MPLVPAHQRLREEDYNFKIYVKGSYLKKRREERKEREGWSGEGRRGMGREKEWVAVCGPVCE